MFNRLAFGEVTTKIKGFSDLNKFEIFIYVLFLIFMLAPGMRPTLLVTNLEQFFLIVTQ